MKLLEKSPLFNRVHDLLWDMIRDGRILPGERMKDAEWAQRLNVSRTPVREAMRKMQQEGILLALSNGGYQLRDVSPVELTQIYRCRAAVEALAAEDAAQDFDERCRARLEKIVDECDRALAQSDWEKVFAWSAKFQAAIIDMSDNGHVKELSNTLHRRILFYQCAMLNRLKSSESQQRAYRERMKAKQSRRRTIIGALVRRDGAEAARLMQINLRLTGESVLIAFSEMQDQRATSDKVA